MDPQQSPTALARLMIPQVLKIIWRSTAHLLSLSETSQYWDMKTTLMMEVLRAYLAPRPYAHRLTVEQAQKTTTHVTTVEDDTWRTCTTYGLESSLEDAVRRIIEQAGAAQGTVHEVGCKELTAEWIGYRSDATAARGEDTPEANYKGMMDELDNGESQHTVLYFHGGAYFLCDPHSHRRIVCRLAKETKTRVFVPRYRLAPQSPFPAQLIDALTSYLYLVFPPAGALHKPIDPSKITFSGDSAGGGLALALLQLIHRLDQSKASVRVGDLETFVPFPNSVATFSAWVDIPRSFGALGGLHSGSEETCMGFDYLPNTSLSPKNSYRDSPSWNPARRQALRQTQFYAPDDMLLNPLVSPITADSWPTHVPVWLSAGDECLRDQNLWFAYWLRKQGVQATLRLVTGMPHVFVGVFMHLAASGREWEALGEWINDPKKEVNECVRIHPTTGIKRVLDEKELQVEDMEMVDVRALLNRAVDAFIKIVGGEEGREETDKGKEDVPAKL